ncbi:MAG: Sec-independent protein translocase protein TatB [Gammaproteobacteria bacterium]|nr:Sec-independent protein translocase protein TatB [Gammaproteobacteria bacterium]
MNIGMQEILVISVLALIVLGPERLPTAIKSIAIWLNRFRRSFNEMKAAIEQEINADEIRQQIHNENVLHELGETRDALDQLGEQLASSLEHNDAASDVSAAKPTKKPPHDSAG